MKTQVVLLLQIMNLKDEFSPCSRYLNLKGFIFVMLAGGQGGGCLRVFCLFLLLPLALQFVAITLIPCMRHVHI